MAARPACDVQDASALPEMEDLVDRLDLGRDLRVDVPDEIVGSEEVLAPPLRDLRHRRAAKLGGGGKPSPPPSPRGACPPCRRPPGRDARGPWLPPASPP